MRYDNQAMVASQFNPGPPNLPSRVRAHDDRAVQHVPTGCLSQADYDYGPELRPGWLCHTGRQRRGNAGPARVRLCQRPLGDPAHYYMERDLDRVLEIQPTNPEALVVGADGYYRVRYDKLGVQMMTLEQWEARHL